MPIFEYQCQTCDHQFETLILSSSDPEPSCPSCNSTNVKKLMSAGCIIGAGSGEVNSDRLNSCGPTSQG